ncbi:GNAT family N-acetyltransferase [Paralimibaculum aggregatum]|uniref:GNAT family N-acetyltransferase n=1 Tax=Paralimibaculum aggregatum TaxID=3036245 RepID=A0ABQ6LNZ1_9RHOB|nr:GNAT family N-acetyltransferase [Limibaculum sp. NKW23]GMG83422.1 GNAT family N-acetyltransferase [Limibaculum sp. NKW23]
MLRPALAGDVPAIAGILNAEIRGGTASWRTAPVSDEDMADWLVERLSAGRPVLVAEADGRVAGYGSYGAFRSGGGYAGTVEHSVYVAASFRRRGIATALLETLIARARDDGLACMVGGISADQAASLALHEKLGFHEAGRLAGVGRKFGRPLDLVLMLLALDAG